MVDLALMLSLGRRGKKDCRPEVVVVVLKSLLCWSALEKYENGYNAVSISCYVVMLGGLAWA